MSVKRKTNPSASYVTSVVGTRIAFDRLGQGPPVVVVSGIFCDRQRTHELAEQPALKFTVINYDRRGRGDSGRRSRTRRPRRSHRHEHVAWRSRPWLDRMDRFPASDPCRFSPARAVPVEARRDPSRRLVAQARARRRRRRRMALNRNRPLEPTRGTMNTIPKHKKAGPLDVSFTAKLQRSAAPGGWVYVVWPESPRFFGTRGLVKVKGLIDGVPFRSSFMALGDGRHKLPVKAEIRAQIDKQPGDTIRVELQARLG